MKQLRNIKTLLNPTQIHLMLMKQKIEYTYSLRLYIYKKH